MALGALYVYFDGKGRIWEPLVRYTNKDRSLEEALKTEAPKGENMNRVDER
jgi:hypothetical protein